MKFWGGGCPDNSPDPKCNQLLTIIALYLDHSLPSERGCASVPSVSPRLDRVILEILAKFNRTDVKARPLSRSGKT